METKQYIAYRFKGFWGSIETVPLEQTQKVYINFDLITLFLYVCI